MRNLILLTVCCLFLSLTVQGQWQPTEGPYGGTANVFSKSPSHLYVGTISGLYKSGNEGKFWDPVIHNLLDNKNILALLSMNDTLFAGTNQGLFRSTDNAGTWEGLTN